MTWSHKPHFERKLSQETVNSLSEETAKNRHSPGVDPLALSPTPILLSPSCVKTSTVQWPQKKSQMHSEKTEIWPRWMEKNFSDYRPHSNAGHSSEGVTRTSILWELCWQEWEQGVLPWPAQLQDSGTASPGISRNSGQVPSSVSALSTHSMVWVSSSASPILQIWLRRT